MDPFKNIEQRILGVLMHIDLALPYIEVPWWLLTFGKMI
jgi:hypothetical protein